MNTLNICNILGIVLLYMPSISFFELNNICNKLREKGYEINIDDDIIYSVISEWKDFFILNDDNNICLTKDIIGKQNIVKVIFSNTISESANNDIFSAMLNRSSEKSKIIKFKN